MIDTFFNNPKLSLPLIGDNQNAEMIDFLESVYEEFLSSIKDNSVVQSIINEEEKEQIEKLCNSIITAIKYYFSGMPSSAVENFYQFGGAEAVYGLPKITYAKDSNFYRLRQSEESNPLKRKDLFHIPFDLRNKISPQRFSIPGYPCLYLGTSVYICWEELNRPDFNRVQAARFENDKNISVVNLCYTQYKNISDTLTDEEKKTLIMSYPIIAACSLKVPDNKQNDPFKLEYIFPQILMQVLLKLPDDINETGIVYSTTKSYKKNSKNDGLFENIVIKTKPNEFKKSNYCNNLKKLFKMTDVIVGKPIEFLRFDETLNKDSFQIKKIELNGLPVVDYSQTKFALLEYLLMEKKAKAIRNDFEGE